MHIRLRPLLILGLLVALIGGGWSVQPTAGEDARSIEIVELSGPLDARALRFAADVIEQAAGGNVEVVVLQIDSPGVVNGERELERLVRLLRNPPLPVAAWVGPAPAVAYGGALQLLVAAPIRAAAPGSVIGYGEPSIAGKSVPPLVGLPPTLAGGVVEVEEPGGVVDIVQPSLRQLVILDLNGLTVEVGGRRVELSTLQPFGEGVTNLPTVIREPGLWDRFLSLALRPEAAFFFLAVGLTIAAFEFYALGPGVAATVAAVSLLLASYGVAVLPVRPWALILTVVSVGVLTVGYQMGGVATLLVAGAAGLGVGGLWFTDAAPQLIPGRLGVGLTVVGVAAFYAVAMPTVTRARLSTRTIGRERLVGRRGMALGDFAPDGEVEVDGARWRATAHRESGIRAGDAVEVVAIDGWYLEVEPVRENQG